MAARVLRTGASFALVVGTLFGFNGSASGAAASRGVPLIARGGRVSGVARPESRVAQYGGAAPSTICSTPGATNYIANCHGTGRAVNETWIATNGASYVAGANDYNSYNGQADFGYYTSTDAKTWTDNGPLDLFAHDANHAAGDPGLAIDAQGVVYYSGISFSYVDCNFGGLELARRDPGTGLWSDYEIQPDSDTAFQDKPAIAIDNQHVFVSWTLYGSCTGVDVTSPIKVAVFDDGPASKAPLRLLAVPGSVYSQGSTMATDGRGGFWIAWEEFSSPTDLTGEIRLAHWSIRNHWSTPQTISPIGFTDIPSPLPGFAFRDNSFPSMAFAGGKPTVIWPSYETGAGRIQVWQSGVVSTVSDSGGNQFFPSISADSLGGYAISWSQTKASNSSFDQYLSYGGVTKDVITQTMVSTASSFPNNDTFFGGAFIGDYNGITAYGGAAHPIWTDLRGPSYFQNAMVFAA
jgi:hypothetical protein